jgi:prevent-host-death family protein
VTASKAKNQFAQIFETALRDGPVFVSKHGTTKAVLLSIEEYEALLQSRRNPAMEALTREYEAMFERMQTPEHRASMDAAFQSTPEEMGAAAVEAARKAVKRPRG